MEVNREEQLALVRLPTLYKRDSKGATREWSVDTAGDVVYVRHGVQGGKLQEQTTICKPKNRGRSNETTAIQQAQAEAQAKWQYQVDREDYNEDVDKAGQQFRPMLAHDYLKVPHRVDFTKTALQPKLDGLRLSFGPRSPFHHDAEFMTRKGDVYKVEHLYEGCTVLLDTIRAMLPSKFHDRLVLDGEVYHHGWPLQNILSAARKPQASTECLQYWLFDICVEGASFEARHLALEAAMYEVAPDYPELVLVKHVPCGSENIARSWQEQCLRAGFEGVMLRHLDSAYAMGKRSPDLFKFKQFFDAECLIIDVKPDLNGNGVLTCVYGPTDQEFGCTPKRTHAERKEMVADPTAVIGKYITVKYQNLTPDGVPMFPVGLDLRDCDESGAPLS